MSLAGIPCRDKPFTSTSESGSDSSIPNRTSPSHAETARSSPELADLPGSTRQSCESIFDRANADPREGGYENRPSGIECWKPRHWRRLLESFPTHSWELAKCSLCSESYDSGQAWFCASTRVVKISSCCFACRVGGITPSIPSGRAHTLHTGSERMGTPTIGHQRHTRRVSRPHAGLLHK
jgi:hypothetical protein